MQKPNPAEADLCGFREETTPSFNICPDCGVEESDIEHWRGGVACLQNQIDNYEKSYDTVYALLKAEEKENAELRAVVDRLPKTADGVVAVPCMPVFYPVPPWDEIWVKPIEDLRVEIRCLLKLPIPKVQRGVIKESDGE